MTLYRDAATGLQGQVASKRGLLASRLEGLSPILRALAPPPLRERIARAPAPEAELPSDLAALAALDAALDDVVDAVDALLAQSTRLRRCPHDVESFPRPVVPPPWLIEEDAGLAFRRRFTTDVLWFSPSAEIVRWGDHAYRARFALRGSPVLVLVRLAAPHDATATTFDGYVRTSVPESMPLVTVRRERMTDAIGKLLGLRRDREVGTAAFDDTFWIAGDEHAATALPPSSVAALLELAPRSPELAFGSGVAEVRFTGRAHAAARDMVPAAAIEAVLAIREAIEGG